MVEIEQSTGRSDSAQRKRISRDLSNNLFVEAGAGTGKTTSLISRFCSLVRNGVAVENIITITFTRAASAELRYRIRDRLAIDLEANSDSGKTQILERLSAAETNINSAPIQTIDSFAFRLLQNDPIAAGLPPILTPLDEFQNAEQFNQRWEHWLTEELSATNTKIGNALQVCNLLGVSQPHLNIKEIAKSFEKHYDLIREEEYGYSVINKAATVQRLLNSAQELKELLPVCQQPKTDALFLHVICKVLPFVDRLTQADNNQYALLANIASVGKVTCRRGVKANWQNQKDKVNQLLNVIEQQRCVLRDSFVNQALNTILSALRDFTINSVDQRRSDGVANFTDMVIWARDMLRDNEQARQKVREQYQYVLVDEFQDTSPAQIDLVALIAGSEHHPGALFVVGDPQQSIYRFRQADIQSVQRFRSQYAATDNVLSLDLNYRSIPAVIHAVNRIFGNIMGNSETTLASDNSDSSETAEGPQITAKYRDLQPGVEIEEFKSFVRLCSVPRESHKAIGSIHSYVAERIVHLAQWVRQGNCRVRESDAQGREHVRQSRLGDMCILLRSRNTLPYLQEELSTSGIPCAAEALQDLYTSQWVTAIVDCVIGLQYPHKELEIVSLLRSPAYSCDDHELRSWREVVSGFNYLNAPATGRQEHSSVAVALADLKRRHTERWDKPAATLAADFVRERQLREMAVLNARNSSHAEEELRLIDTIIEEIRHLESGDSGTLPHVADTLEKARVQNHFVSCTQASQGETDAVKIMTIHAAKGLEFPIVVLLGKPQSVLRGSTLFAQPGNNYGTQVKLSNDVKTPHFDARVEMEKQAITAEEERLLYVGATRARDHLFMAFLDKTASHSEQVIAKTLAEEGNEFEWPDTPSATTSDVSQNETDSQEIAKYVAQRGEWVEELNRVILKASRPSYVNATSLRRSGDRPAPKKPYEVAFTEAQVRGRAGSKIGRAVHGALQRYTEAPTDDLNAIAEESATNHGVPEHLTTVLDMLRATLSNTVVAHAMTRPHWQETPVTAQYKQGLAIEGIIDMVFSEEDGSLVIIDYKTERIGGATLAAKAEPYIPQIGAYTYALERSTECPVSKGLLVFCEELVRGREGIFAIKDLAGAKAVALGLADSVITTRAEPLTNSANA